VALYRQTRLLGVLLILQVIAMVGIGVWLFANVDWDRVLILVNEQGQVRAQSVEGPWLKPLEQAILYAIYFLAPAILLLLAGLGFVLLRRRGWMLASVAQAICLLVCLFSYTDPRPWFAYPIIAYCILMILYLNSQGVRAVVHSRRMAPAGARSETARGE
jgi:MFS family permease